MQPTKHGRERSNEELVPTTARIAQDAEVDAIVVVTESGGLGRLLAQELLPAPLIIATANSDTHAALVDDGLEAVRLPLQAADRFGQIRHALAVATVLGHIAPGQFALCVLGRAVYPEEGVLLVLSEVSEARRWPSVTDLLRLTDGIRPNAMEATLAVASKIGRVVRRGSDRIGAIFMLGDSDAVLAGSRQLVPNPFSGHEGAMRTIANEGLHDALIELAKLDGAFVLRGDGFIRAAAVFLASNMPEETVEIPTGLGARHLVAATMTARTEATAVVVSATDGNIRVFAGGRLVLQLDPAVPHGPVSVEDESRE
ncbi:MAG TPA: diadenylate cyclase [Candidatus Sulfomarinibacteraceae bacterium]|nr:diadenylate cyclase [Candidatus Sulfomarinibacteraceae bacterium]